MGKEKQDKQKILIVDDSEMKRAILSEMLGDEYEIIEAEDGAQAIAVLQKHSVELSLVLLDIVMPVMDGYDVLTVMNNKRWIEDVPVIMISAENSPAFIDRAYELGVTDFISRPFDALVVRRRVVNTILLYAKQKKLMGLVADQIYEKEKSNSLMIAILSHIVEFRNGESGLHVLHVQAITEILLRTLRRITDKYSISDADIALISTASALHDIGKISIPEEILNKPGRFTPEEFAIMKTHSMVGASMLDALSLYKDEPLIKVAYEICRWHHERFDGRGYPDGLKGDDIPISAQIVALADVYDALTSERVYKKAFTHDVAVNMILNGECGTFNPLLMECLKEAAESIQSELKDGSGSHNKEKEIKSIANELLRHDELSSSERTLQLLEYERMKNRFYTAMSKKILFEYTVVPSMLMLSAYGADKLGLNEFVMDPFEDEKMNSIIEAEDLEKLSDALHNTVPEEPIVEYDCKLNYGGKVHYVRISCRSTWTYGKHPHYAGAIGTIVDIDKNNETPELLEQISAYDTLTGLLNYEYSKYFIQKLLDSKPDSKFALAVIDVDSFKTVNNQYGHIAGNDLLMHAAEKVRRCIRKGDIAARVGGDEFLVFVECGEGYEAVINRIFSVLCDEGDGFPISVSMGATKADITGMDYATLFRQAAQALYGAKKNGKGQLMFYDNSMHDMLTIISPIDEEKVGENREDTENI